MGQYRFTHLPKKKSFKHGYKMTRWKRSGIDAEKLSIKSNNSVSGMKITMDDRFASAASKHTSVSIDRAKFWHDLTHSKTSCGNKNNRTCMVTSMTKRSLLFTNLYRSNANSKPNVSPYWIE